jgi:hypothetical protein
VAYGAIPPLTRRWRRSLDHALQTSTITTYAPASRLRAGWMEARVTKGGQGFGKVLARRNTLFGSGSLEKVNFTSRRFRHSPHTPARPNYTFVVRTTILPEDL